LLLAGTAAATAAGSAAAGEAATMFRGRTVAGRACVALAVAGFISLEVLERLRAALRHRAGVPVLWIVAVVHMAVEAVAAMEPGAGPDEQASAKPIGAVVAVRRTAIGRVIEIPIRAHRGHSNADADLSGCGRYDGASAKQYSSDGGKNERFEVAHWFSLESSRFDAK
jgi:hypothetical protein